MTLCLGALLGALLVGRAQAHDTPPHSHHESQPQDAQDPPPTAPMARSPMALGAGELGARAGEITEPRGKYVEQEELDQAREQALQEWGRSERMRKIVEQTMPKGAQVSRSSFEIFFKRFVPPRAALDALVAPFRARHPEFRSPDLDKMSTQQLEKLARRFQERIALEDPQAAAKLKALVQKVSSAHGDFMRAGGDVAGNLMSADPAAKLFMSDPKGHDQNWTSSQPDSLPAWEYVARQRMLDGDKQGALAAAERAAELGPGDARGLALVAAAQYDLKNYDAAIEAARGALGIDPNNALAMTVTKLAHDPAQASVATAAPSASDGVAGGLPLGSVSDVLSPSLSPQALQSLQFTRQAQKALGVGDFSRAAETAREAIVLSPSFAHAYGVLGFALAKQGRLEESLQQSAKGLKLNAFDRMSHNARQLALNKSGRYQDALAASAAALAADPRSGYARYMTAAARSALGDRAGALEALRQAGQIDPRYDELYRAALQLPQDSDMGLLFAEVKPKDAAAAPAPRLQRVAAIAAAAAAGGVLLGVGLLGFAMRRSGGGLKTVFSPPTRPIADFAGRTIGGQFKITRRIGQGGMGTVYEGTDLTLGRRVAIKRMRDDLKADRRLRERFVTEARLVAALSHPNVVALYSIVDENDELSLIFEYVEGKTLHDLITERHALPFPEAMRLLRGVAAALEAAHARGIIHRDLKPSNVMVTSEGAVKVMDFGIARAKDSVSRNSLTNTIVGTPPYMSPEQEQGAVRLESDVYALAVLAYEALSGALPFSGSAGGMLMNKINKAFVPVTRVVGGLPAGLDAVFDRALEPDPEKRYRTVSQLRAALDALQVAA